MAADPIFLDTSFVVAATVEEHPSYRSALSYLGQLETASTPLCISPQVCREFLVVLTRMPVSGRAFSVEEALGALEGWRQVCTVLEENRAVVDEWTRLVAVYEVRGKQVHDCNIVAVMRVHGIVRLATRNPADFERYQTEIRIEAIRD